jgi:hypothetical protein
VTLFDSSDSWTFTGGTAFSPVVWSDEYAYVKIAGTTLSPGAGTVTFTDALGRKICSVTVYPGEGDTQLFCNTLGPSGQLPTTVFYPTNPITATYSGTSRGTNDGLGTDYAASSNSGTQAVT